MRRSWLAVYCFLFPVVADAGNTIDFRAFVQSGYTHREALPGTSATAEAIERSLGQISGAAVTPKIVRDQSPEELKIFLRSLPDEKTADWSVVYIAGHQSAAGEFEFTGKQKILWSRLLEDVAIPANSRRITILDACYAESADLRSDLVKVLGPVLVFTSAAGEKTYELELGTRRPVDYTRRYPREMEWLQKRAGPDPVKQITFFGFMWTKAFLEKPISSFSQEEWQAFLLRIKSAAETFRRERSERLSSDIVIRN